MVIARRGRLSIKPSGIAQRVSLRKLMGEYEAVPEDSADWICMLDAVILNLQPNERGRIAKITGFKHRPALNKCW